MQWFTGPHKIKTILQDNNNWQRFALEHPQLMSPAILESIQKLFDCGTEAMGYHTYVCPQCGYTAKVPHSCKSRFCSSCGKVATDKWMNESLNRLLNIPLLEMYSTDSKIRKLLNDLWCKIWYVFIGKRLSDASYTIHYIGRYTKRPVISETRIYKYDGKTVTFLYKDTSTGEKTHVTLPVDEFIKRLIQHIPDKHFRQVRYYGIFAPKSQSTGLDIARKLVNKPPARMVKSLPQNWRERRISQTGFDPLICPRCNIELELVDVTYGPDYNDYTLELFDARGDPCFGNVKCS
jgi:hypothetical protein